LPASASADVSQYGADYIQVRRPSGEVSIQFEGKTQVGLVNASPKGKRSWWSNRGDDSDTTLTRSVDLTGQKAATLTFSTWYDIEEGWDYLYVQASTDGGKTWQIIPGRYTNDKDKSGNAYGPGWTGKSGGGRTAQWVDERIDLSRYAGQKIELRFEYVTDDAVNGPGFLLDDVAINELNFKDGGEDGPNGWRAEGWILTDNVLSQRWLVQVLSLGNEGVQVQRLNVDSSGKGELKLPNASGLTSLIVIVSGEAAVTTERASYSYNITSR
jgi:hypothetical protein